MDSIFRKHEDGYEAVPAVVVADKTDKLGKRLAQLAFGLLILFFAINGYIQSAQNEKKLDDAETNTSQLVESLDRVTKTLDQQSKLILELQDAVRAQNQTLRDAGLKTLPVPGEMTLPSASSDPVEQPSPNPTPRDDPEPNDPEPNDPEPNDPDPNDPEPEPEPEPSPVVPVDELLCMLTGICT